MVNRGIPCNSMVYFHKGNEGDICQGSVVCSEVAQQPDSGSAHHDAVGQEVLGGSKA